MFSSKLLHLTKIPSKFPLAMRHKSNYQLKEQVDKCVTHFHSNKESCAKKVGRGCRSANPSIKCVSVSPERICKKIVAPKESYREMLLAAQRHIRKPCVNECCCLADFMHKVSVNDVVRH